MSKGLEVWYLLKKYLEKEHHKIVKEDIPLKTVEGMPLDTIEKELKALEIIKKKECIFKGLSETNQEEYELLKEVLL